MQLLIPVCLLTYMQIYLRYTAALNKDCDPRSVWPQATAECLAASLMTGSSEHCIPCFAGDLNRHIIVHLAQEDKRDVHIARHDDTPRGKSMALAYMHHLQHQGLARLAQSSSSIVQSESKPCLHITLLYYHKLVLARP
jgi:hypothetical protein